MVTKTRKSKSRRGSSRSVRLKPANSFDLIRLIAHSQSDTRKAIAELVQNSLDAEAATVTITMRPRVAGSEVWVLRLFRDEPLADVTRIPQARMAFQGDTWTEILIRGVHSGPSRQLSSRRLGEYLSSELRGW